MNELDPQAVSLAKSIRQTESGGNFSAKGKSGEFGAYQWMPETWRSHAQQALGDPNAPMTPSNQNAVAYTIIKQWKDAGLNPAQIAAKWNSGSEVGWENKIGVNDKGVQYNVPLYVKKVTDTYQQFKLQQVQPNQPVQDVAQPESNATFASSPTDSPLTAGLKTLGNIPQSLYNFGKGVVQSFNPINIASNISQIPSAFQGAVEANGGVGGAITNTITSIPSEAYKATVPEAGRALLRGDLQTAQRAITEDPVGSIAPFLLATQQIAGKAGYGEVFDNAISKTARPVIDTTKAIGSVPTNIVGGVIKSASSHLLGLEPNSIKTIIENPEAFSKLQQDQMSRGGLANEFGSAIDKLESTLNETGSAYQPIREANVVTSLPENFIPSVFKKFGLEIVDGKVVADTKSITRNTGDIRALQNFVDNWGDKTNLTSGEYLNMRKDIAGIAKFGKEIGVNADAQVVGKELYAKANETVRPQIKGLKELDDQYSPIKQQFDQVKKDFLKKETDGSYVFKDGAVNRIANAIGVGKDSLLARMEEVLPGITKKIEILKAVEDIDKAYGNKVGTYAKGMIGAGAVLTGNMPAVVAAIMTNPSIAVPLLRGLGWGISKIQPVVYTLKVMAGDINNPKFFESAKKLNVQGTTDTTNIPFTNADKVATKIPVKSIPSDYPNSMYTKPKDLPTIDMGKTPKPKTDKTLPTIR